MMRVKSATGEAMGGGADSGLASKCRAILVRFKKLPTLGADQGGLHPAVV